MRIMYPHDANERHGAIEEAAFKPALFQELRDKWPDRPPSDESLRPYLVRKGFSEGALDQVIRFYRETIDIVQDGRGGHDSPSRDQPKDEPVHASQPHAHASTEQAMPAAQPAATLTNKRPFSLSFDGAALTGVVSLKSVKEVNSLLKYLGAHKAYLDSISEDDAFDAENDDTE